MTNENLVKDNMRLAYKIAGTYYHIFNGKIDYEDLESLSLMGLCKAAEKYKEELGYAFSTYAYKTMKNEILANYKRNIRQKDVSLFKPIGEEIEIKDTLSDDMECITNIESKLNNSVLRKNIAELNDRQRFVIEMSLNGYTRKQIAEKTGMNLSNVNNIYNGAINNLRRKMERLN